MGKKRVAQKTGEEAIKESEPKEAKRSKGASGKRKYDSGKVYVRATYNNTMMTVTDESGNVITWMSAGSLGFSGPKKSTPFAASKVAEALAQKVERSRPKSIDVLVSGIGNGRDSAIRSLANRGFSIKVIKDVTPIPHNGPRAKKPRRV